MASKAYVIIIDKATGLRNADGALGKSDPYCIMSMPMSQPAVSEVKTEVIQVQQRRKTSASDILPSGNHVVYTARCFMYPRRVTLDHYEGSSR